MSVLTCTLTVLPVVISLMTLRENTFQHKSIGIAAKKTDKINAAKLAEKLKVQIVSGVQQIAPVTVPPKEIRDLRALFATYRILRK